jgi:phosphate-selective porin OprO and OprP
MTILTKKRILAASALCALMTATGARAAGDANAIEARLRALEAEIAKLRKEARQAKAQAAAATEAAGKASERASTATNVANAAHGKVDPNAPPPPPPVYVTLGLGKGLLVESEDKSNSFKIGGRILMDGGGTAGSPGNGWNGNAGFSQARLEVEGKVKPWFYKFQYDFASTTVQLWNTNLPNADVYGATFTSGACAAAGTCAFGGNALAYWARNYVTDRNFLWGGFRDAYLGLQDPRITLPGLAEPVYFKIGSQWEPFSLEATEASKFRDTIERPMAVDAIAPARHLGASFGMVGKDNWTLGAGLYTLSFQDLNMRPVNTSSGNVGVIVPTYSGVGIANANWYQPSGGGAYWEATGRTTWAPIFDEHRLVHIGASGSYHQVNSSTAYSDDRNLAPGNRLGSEANILGTTFLGTTDLSCGRFNQTGFVVPPSALPGTGGWNAYSAAGNCVNNIEKVAVEAALSYNNFFVQGEWLLSNYNRNTVAAAEFARAQLNLQGASTTPSTGYYLSPGNSHYLASGGYVQGEWWITGEEKSQSYKLNDKNTGAATFTELKIKNPFSKGGWGAWGLVGRWSVLNLNNGPFSGGNINQALAYANNSFGLFQGPVANMTPAQIANSTLMVNAISNSGIYGGYQQNVTAGVNWYPDSGVAFQFNATHVMSLKSPLNWNPQSSYEGGSHPTFLELRTKVFF